MKAQWKIQRVTVALLCAVAASGCDSRQPLGPATRVARRASVDAPQALGGGFVPAPGNTSPAAVSNPPSVNLLTLPESTWVVLDVTGNIQLTWNAAPCAQRLLEAPNWACQDGSPLVNFDAGPWEGGPVWLRTGEGSGGLVRLRGAGGANSGAAIGLYYAAQAVTLTGHVNMTAQWAPDPNFGNGPFSYHVSGGYSVAATAVPSPLQLTEGEPDSTGERPYTVEALYGLQFINPAGYPGHIPAGATFWRFFPGDSVGDTPDRTGGGWDVRECQNQVVCRYRPPVSGRMQVQAYVEGQFADVRSKRAPGQCQNAANAFRATVSGTCSGNQEAIKLTCDKTTPNRGEEIKCTASAVPPGEDLIVSEWTFEGENSTIHPEAGEEHSLEWGGRMVVSGTISVTGTVNGKALTVREAITVQSRPNWAIAFPALPDTEWVGGPGTELPYPPPNTRVGTESHGTLGKFSEVPPSYGLDEGSGPNQGWVYVPDPPVFGTLHLYLNRALRPTDPFYRLQNGDESGGVHHYERPICGPQFMARAAQETAAHETGHYNVSAGFWTAKAVADKFEQWHVYDKEGRVDAGYARRELTAPLWDQLGQLQQAWDGKSVLLVPCDFAQPSS